MATIVTRSDVPWAYLPTLAELQMQTMESPTLYKEFMEMKDSSVSPDKRGISTAFVVGLGPLQNWGEVIPVPFDTPDPGRIKTTAYLDFGVACAISRNAVEDELYGVNAAIGKGLPKSHQLHRDLAGARLLNNFFATTYYTDDSPTARALGATNHGSTNGASRSNILATSQSLSYQGVLDLLVQGWQHNSEKGYAEPMWEMGEDMILMVAPADAPMAIKIADSMATKDPTNNSNAVNVVSRMARLRVVVNPYLTSVGAGNYWFIIRGSDVGIWLVERRPPEISTYRDPATKALVVDLTCREGVHIKHTWGLWASGN